MAKILMVDPDTDEVEQSFKTLSDAGRYVCFNNDLALATVIGKIWQATKYGYKAYGKYWRVCLRKNQKKKRR